MSPGREAPDLEPAGGCSVGYGSNDVFCESNGRFFFSTDDVFVEGLKKGVGRHTQSSSCSHGRNILNFSITVS